MLTFLAMSLLPSKQVTPRLLYSIWHYWKQTSMVLFSWRFAENSTALSAPGVNTVLLKFPI